MQHASLHIPIGSSRPPRNIPIRTERAFQHWFGRVQKTRRTARDNNTQHTTNAYVERAARPSNQRRKGHSERARMCSRAIGRHPFVSITSTTTAQYEREPLSWLHAARVYSIARLFPAFGLEWTGTKCIGARCCTCRHSSNQLVARLRRRR